MHRHARAVSPPTDGSALMVMSLTDIMVAARRYAILLALLVTSAITVFAGLVAAIACIVLTASLIVIGATRDIPRQQVEHAWHVPIPVKITVSISSIVKGMCGLVPAVRRVRADTSQLLVILALRVMETMVKDVARRRRTPPCASTKTSMRAKRIPIV